MRRDEVAVPLEAVLRRALERLEVDVDDPEATRDTEGPFEVVEQGPEEVAPHGHAVRDRRSECIEVPSIYACAHLAPVVEVCVDGDVAADQ